MKKTLLCAVMAIGAMWSHGQVTTDVLQPSSLAGALTFTWANDWGSTPDLNDPANNVQGYAAFVDDGTAADSLGCDALVNGADIIGKIAIVYRGTCEFGAKALNAQNAGAIAVVIVNNQGAPVGMGGGAVGFQVTIPVVMISTTSGALLRNEIIAGNVELFIGSIYGLYNDNLYVSKREALIPQYSALPAGLANASNFTVDLGCWLKNFGNNTQNDISLSCVIMQNGAEVYNQTSTGSTMALGDSLYYSLPLWTESVWSGLYTATYSINTANTDESPNDNVFTFNFLADDLLAYSRLDEATLLPLQETFQRAGGPAGSPTPDNYSVCSYFTDPNASMYKVEGLYTGVTKANNASLEVDYVEAKIYEWNEGFTGWSDAQLTDIIEVSSTDYFFTDSIAPNPLYIPFAEPFTLEDNVKYLFCSFVAPNNLFLGHGESLEYTLYQTTFDEPVYLISNDGDWNTFADPVHSAVGAKMALVDIGISENDRLDIRAYPNPTTDQITIPLIGQSGVGHLQLFDQSGKKVSEQKVSVSDGSKITVNVSDLATGTYLFDLKFENGKHASFRAVVTK